MISITIPGRPVPWARTTYNAGRIVTKTRQASYMEQVAEIVGLEMNRQGVKQLQGPLSMQSIFDYGRNQARFEVRELHVDDEYFTRRPDLSNLIKIIEDSIVDHNRKCRHTCKRHAGLIHDDAQIVALHAEKLK